MANAIDFGDICLWCGSDTAQGSGLWIDRIGATRDVGEFAGDILDNEITITGWSEELREVSLVYYDEVTGWMCRECLAEGESENE